jgi:hypothetical protein
MYQYYDADDGWWIDDVVLTDLRESPSPCAPPGEVAQDLEFIAAHDLAWTATAGIDGYGLYRGVMTGVWGYDHSCVAPMLRVPQASDLAEPGPGQGYYYLVSGRSIWCEGSLGADSNGMQRPNPRPCP